MAKRSNQDFAWQMGRAHEFGDKNQPANEHDMDLRNNSKGRSVALGNEKRSDGWLAGQCKAKADNQELITLK